MPEIVESYVVGRPYDPAATLSLLSIGPGDPCLRVDGPNRVRLALNGPTDDLVLTVESTSDRLDVRVVGADADWLQPLLPALLGLDFEVPTLDRPRRLREVAHRYRGMRLPRAPLLFPRLVPIVLQQLISWRDAAHGWRQLVRRHGRPADGYDDLIAPPAADVLARMPSHAFVECGILPQHGRRIVSLAREARRIEKAWNAGLDDDAVRRTCDFLGRLRGIGPWTLGYLRGSSMADADALVPGDYSFPSQVAFFFERAEEGTDEDLFRLLQPYEPNRFYVLWLVIKSHAQPPRRAPRGQPLRHRMRGR